jgi:NADH-quinone oxidoreductase subunit N
MDFSRATAHALDSLGSFVPELILCGAILLVLLADLLIGRGRHLSGETARGRIPGWIALAGLLASAVAAWAQLDDAPRLIFFGMLSADPLAAFFKLLFALSSALIVLVSFRLRPQGELHILLLIAVLGMDLLAGSRHLLMAVIALEMVSIMSYVLAGYDRSDARAGEAALKYMVFGSMASGAMLYGGSLLYGLTGTLDLAAMQWTLRSGVGEPLILLLALLLVMAGIGYKIAMVPFHYWCPDVYDGAPTPITTFFSVGPKAAGLALLIRFLYPRLSEGELAPLLPSHGFEPLFVLAVIAAFTMTLGNFAAIGQTQVKRLLAYSSIAHAGYLLMGLVIADSRGLEAVLVYLVLYLLMNYGAFLVLDAVGRIRGGDESLAAFHGLGRSHPALAGAMTVFLVSLVGLPPLAGFIGKYVLFAAVVDARWYGLVTIAVLNSVVSLYYYFSLVKAMYLSPLEEGVAEDRRVPLMHAGIIAGLCALTLVFGIWWEPLSRLASGSIAGSL